LSDNLRFLPWVRAGAPDGSAIQIQASGKDAQVPFTCYGPGDVVGLAQGQIVRRSPLPNSQSMPPNLFPYVEFAAPDLPWQLTPGTPDAQSRLAPWLALIVIEVRGDSPLGNIPDAKLPVVEVNRVDLPVYSELWLWAHVQVDGASVVAADGTVAPDVASRGVARILSPRALAPKTRYVACLVPTFEAGRLAGLGQPVPSPLATDPAWSAGDGTVKLPVYDSWFFTTTESGDIETLARKLQERDLSAGNRPKQMGVDTVSGDVAGRLAPFEGAFRPLGPAAAWTGPAVSAAKTSLSSMMERNITSGVPVVGPPLYGSIASGATTVTSGWLADLNLDPRRRAAAGLGSDAVRAHQDELVAEAWRQAGDIARARRELQGSLLAQFTSASLFARSIAPLSGSHALVTLAPAISRMREGAGSTVAMRVAASALPSPSLGSAFRRLLVTKTPAAARRAGLGIRKVLAQQNALTVSPGQLPPTPAKLITTASVRAAIPANVIIHGSTHTTTHDTTLGHAGPAAVETTTSAGAADTTATTTPSAPRTIDRSVLSGRFALSASQLEILNTAAPAIDARAPATITVVRPAAFAWISPAPAAGTQVASARFTRRLDLGDAAQIKTGPGIVIQPRFTMPFAPWLDPSFLLTGIAIPPDTAGMLEVNNEFVEAVLAGANHELARELLWRGVPLDRQTTPLTRFFDSLSSADAQDMTPVSQWTLASALGSHLNFGERVVLVLRSRLVGHLSETVIYLARAVADGTYRKPGPSQSLPVFRGPAGVDTEYLGFNITPEDLASGLGYYVVIQELPHAVRFGLDESGPATLKTWDDLAWTQVTPVGGYFSPAKSQLAAANPAGLRWGFNSAHMAAICLQHPIRISIHSSLLLPPKN
jgi:hypothetical protein